MVGRPNRSKGCMTCRKRRKGCGKRRPPRAIDQPTVELRRHPRIPDRKKPKCSNCERNGFECGGYLGFETIEYVPKGDSGHESDGSSALSSKSPGSVSPKLCTTLGSEDDGMYFTHLKYALFETRSDYDTGLAEWVGFRSMDRPNSLSYRCLNAFSRVFYGKVREANTISRKGVRLYVDCLGEVNSSLSCPAKRCSPDVLLSVAILGCYEVRPIQSCSTISIWFHKC